MLEGIRSLPHPECALNSRRANELDRLYPVFVPYTYRVPIVLGLRTSPRNGIVSQASAARGCREIRRVVRQQRRRRPSLVVRGRTRLDDGIWHLSFVCAGWPLHLAAQDPADELLRLRLPVLRQPTLQRRSARALHDR